MDNNSKYLNPEILDTISSYCNSYLESNFSNYLYKTSKVFHSDINGFGKYAFSSFLTSEDFKDYDWLIRYQDAYFDVNVETSIKSGMLITET